MHRIQRGRRTDPGPRPTPSVVNPTLAVVIPTLLALAATPALALEAPPALRLDLAARHAQPAPARAPARGVARVAAVPTDAAPGAAPDTLRLPALDSVVTIYRDPYGIDHIYARTEHDLFFAQGWNVARDRLFQLEVWRRQATGTLAEIQGPRALDRDIGARLLRFRGDMGKELAHYHPHGAAIIGAFVDGINAYIDLTRRRPELLPPEFHWLGIEPHYWTPAVVVSRHNGLFRNATSELHDLRLVRAVGAARARELLDLEPGSPDLTPDTALPNEIPERVLETYRASRAPVTWTAADLAEGEGSGGGAGASAGAGAGSSPAGGRAAARSGSGWGWGSSAADEGRLAALDAESEAAAAGPGAGDVADRDRFAGSNDWVVAGRLTRTGRPIMANDPHRTLTLPSLRYWVHLVAPGWDVIGGGEPALPGVSIGHNRAGAWGLTIFAVDQEDLVVYRTDPKHPLRYRDGRTWRLMRQERDTLRVKGQGDVAVTLDYAREGPVLYEDSAAHRAYVLRAAWLQVGGAPYLASLRMDQADSWAAFRAACAYSNTPSENMVWADTAGHIGWQAVGITPIRQGYNGLLPVPGDGHHEWTGFLPILQLPHEADPKRGFIATANQYDVPAGFPVQVGFSWSNPWRVNRIKEVLGAGRRLSMRDMEALQQDVVSMPARKLTPLLAHMHAGDPRVERARQMLVDWNHVMAADDVAAAIYEAWLDNVTRRLIRVLAPGAPAGLITRLSSRTVVRLMTAPDRSLGPEPVARRDYLVLAALSDAVAQLTRKLGPDMSHWQWGQTRQHHAWLADPLAAALGLAPGDTTAGGLRLDVGPLPRPGDNETVNATWSMTQTGGASFRMIADVGGWNNSVGTNTPGQSGDPRSPHFGDLFAMWATGRYFPVAFTHRRVVGTAEQETVLAPR